MSPSRNVAKILQKQGFGTAKECRLACHQGRVQLTQDEGKTWTLLKDPDQPWVSGSTRIRFDNWDLPYREKLMVLLHKPPGYECSRNPGQYPSVFEIFPTPFLNRGLQPIGRLDADTTGALLFTDQGEWNHRLAGPRHHVAKTYLAETGTRISDQGVQSLREGLLLRGENKPTLPAHADAIGPQQLRITLHEGRYHQVKRMLAAIGSPLTRLHRESVGGLHLEGLAQSEWRELSPEEIGTLFPASRA
jgi:16S rRNA pseudouridine516 synthase